MPCDIAVNITDDVYFGVYNRKKKHPCDIPSVVERAKKSNISMIFLGVSLQTSIESVYLASKYNQYSSIGIHPGSARECTDKDISSLVEILRFESPDKYSSIVREDLLEVLNGAMPVKNRIVAIGEVGLDYFREYSPKEKQKYVFEQMLDLSEISSLPYILHSRDCHREFMEMIDGYRIRGVVHSFTGTAEEAKDLLKKGYYIGVTGASLRENTEAHFIEEIPADKLLVETDAPWCTLRKTSEYYAKTKEYLDYKKAWSLENGIKGRNEPVNIFQVLDSISYIKNIPVSTLIEETDKNFARLFLS